MEPGTPIRVEMTKWGDRPHWEFDGIHLGSDEHGEWLGFPEGTINTRPGLELVSQAACVTLVTAEGWYAATFHAPGIWCDLYVDIATPLLIAVGVTWLATRPTARALLSICRCLSALPSHLAASRFRSLSSIRALP